MNDVIELTMLCNKVLRDDQIAYVMGHTELVTDVDGKEVKALSVIGKKSKRTPPEAFFPICLFTATEDDGDGNVSFYFETKKSRYSKVLKHSYRSFSRRPTFLSLKIK